MAAQLQLIANNKEGAKILREDAICRQKISELLVKNNLPNGLLPVKDVIECGYNEATGFLWVRQKSKVDHKFSAINKTAKFEQEFSAFVDDRRMRKISGVKAKELMVWLTIAEFCVDENNPKKLNFITSVGAKKSFPFSAFELPK